MFRGDQIYFRNLISEDVDLMLAWENNPVNWKVSSVSKPYLRSEIEEFVQVNQDIFICNQLRLVICLNETNEIIGNVDLFDFEQEHHRVGVGILIDEKYRNKKFGTKVLQLLEEYCKVVLGVRNLFCNILVDNPNSIQLFERNGFLKVGIRLNWHLHDGEWYDEILYQKEIS